MGAGGVIQKAKVFLVAVTDPTLYQALSAATKALVDAIDAKDPMSRTQDDCDKLLAALTEANYGC
jgi:hypothetical protein